MLSAVPPVCFFADVSNRAIDRIQTSLGEDDLPLLNGGRNYWIAQTYFHLSRSGFPVRMVNQPVKGAVMVYHVDDRRALYDGGDITPGTTVVAVRADRPGDPRADYEVLQSGYFADGARYVHIPHWPQSGLIERDPGRGSAISVLGFKGLIRNLDPGLLGDWFRGELASRAIELDIDAEDRAADNDLPPFVDYRNIDVVVALRPPGKPRHRNKPASKLVNAWAAGVPAIVGTEFAYEELKTSPLAFLEANDPAEVIAAVDRLRGDPKLYADMVAHGKSRFREFCVDAVTRRWSQFLSQVLEQSQRRRRLLPRSVSGLARRVYWQLADRLE